ncbi:putative mitochondrial diacylglycerol kinase-like protein [Leptomonas pyrrhocoris]|uniref:Diacylglycerol kinase n=1 Tax=Leptomonas pyrrhocoris TaxID=157538 RepID=A0A0N0DVT3_LEPPY|nr:putative mitochondrial diacylglycerol kinase-like protein [Leptomonas pyrrhocoris]KPA80581.1 putative mitochondrial diacylglycerol kinase-like protein [Leptomonas pyrrhocoris]|eukprot:XP_015659020.1 putative mitochondrial diacylglycerol kinase-like protein [Leptomonas pyrrhocoris]
MADYPTDNQQFFSEPERPCALVNKCSGERSAALFVSDQLKKHFGEDNVFDLFPVKGKPPLIEEAKQFVAQRKPDLLVVAGGDGTVSLGLDIVDAVRAADLIGPATAPIAVIPMGTGNDLSRSLGFGGGYHTPLVKAEEQFGKLLRRLFAARPCKIDRFSLSITAVDHDAVAAGHSGAVNGHKKSGESPASPRPKEKKEDRSFEEADHHPYSRPDEADDSAEQQHEQQQEFSSPLPVRSFSSNPKEVKKVFTNYFSIGFDAQVAKQFGDFRDHNPEMCKSRVINKMWYGCFGCNAMCCANTLPKKQLSLTLDGTAQKVPSNMKSIVVSNMITYAGGNVLWGDAHHQYDAPAVDDGKVEVVALEGVWHMVGVGTQTRSGKKLGQASSLVLYAPANFTMQYDGEPIAAIGTADQMVKVAIEFKSQSLGMRGSPPSSSEKETNDEAVQALHSEREHK